MTVDWSNWLNLSDEQRSDLWHRYRQIVKQESERALATNYRRMNVALGIVRA